MTTSNKIADILKSVYSNSINQQLNQPAFPYASNVVYEIFNCCYCGTRTKSIYPVLAQVCDECLETEGERYIDAPFNFLGVVERRLKSKWDEQQCATASSHDIMQTLFEGWMLDMLRIEIDERGGLLWAKKEEFIIKFNKLTLLAGFNYRFKDAYWTGIGSTKKNIWEDLEERFDEINV